MFRVIAEQGHYAGRTVPTSTRQGTYALTPSGKFLGSINTNSAEAMARMLRAALAKWETMPRTDRLQVSDPAAVSDQIRRPERLFPTDGLALRVFSRDLPRANATADWRGRAWNQDYAWFKKEEAVAFVPERLQRGATRDVPAEAWRRFVRLNIVDNVRGQTGPYAPNEVKRAELRSEVISRDGFTVKLRLTGAARVEAEGRWPVADARDAANPGLQRRGIDLELRGEAEFRLDTGQFTRFDLTGQGMRWGATQYNGRTDDPGPAPIAFAMRIAGSTAAERVAPAHWWAYGW